MPPAPLAVLAASAVCAPPVHAGSFNGYTCSIDGAFYANREVVSPVTAAESLQVRQSARGAGGERVTADCGLFSPIWTPSRVSVPNQIARSRHEPWASGRELPSRTRRGGQL